MKLSVEVEVLNTVMSLLESQVGDEDLDKVLETQEVLDLKDQLKQANAKWVVIKVDETHHWTIAPEGTKVYGIFLVDLNEVTYLCELRPSHYCYHLYNISDPYDEEIEDAVILDDQNIYLHTDNIPKDHHMCGPVEDHEIEDSYEAMVETYLEHYRGNHVY